MKANDPNTTVLYSCDSPKTAVIWLHGLGSHGSDFEDFINQINMPGGIKLILPHAPSRPVTLNGGMSMPAWCDVLELGINAKTDQESVLKAIQFAHDLIYHELALGFSPNRILLGGFSLGGIIALTAALYFPKRLLGAVGFSCLLTTKTSIPLATETSTPILMCHGEEDDVITVNDSKSSMLSLKSSQYDVAWHSFPMGHTVCQAEMNTLNDWLCKRLSST